MGRYPRRRDGEVWGRWNGESCKLIWMVTIVIICWSFLSGVKCSPLSALRHAGGGLDGESSIREDNGGTNGGGGGVDPYSILSGIYPHLRIGSLGAGESGAGKSGAREKGAGESGTGESGTGESDDGESSAGFSSHLRPRVREKVENISAHNKRDDGTFSGGSFRIIMSPPRPSDDDKEGNEVEDGRGGQHEGEGEDEADNGSQGSFADIQRDVERGASKDYEITDLKWYELVLLAREEASCLKDLGGSQYKPGRGWEEDDFFYPFVCPANSSECEKCRQLTSRRDGESCEKLCNNSTKGWSCVERCEGIWRRVKAVMDKIAAQYSWEDGGSEGGNFSSPVFSPRLGRKDSRGESILETELSALRGEASPPETLYVFCEGVTQYQAQGGGGGSGFAEHSPRSPTQPLARAGKFNEHFIVLKIKINLTREEEKVGEDSVSAYTGHNPIVFVIEQRECLLSEKNTCGGNLWTPWKALRKTIFGLNEIHVDYNGGLYEWRVTIVDSVGVVDQLSSAPYKALKGYVEPGEPKKIYVIRNKIVGASMVSVLIGWDPPDERTCFYKIILENHDRDEKPRTIRIRRPQGTHRYWFDDLRFGTSYEVRITSRSANWDHEGESTHASLTFTTPTCLEVHEYRFSECEPPPPRNLTWVLNIKGMKEAFPESSLALKISWTPPLHASDRNKVTKYLISLAPFSFSLGGSRADKSVPADPLVFASANGSLAFHAGDETHLGPWTVGGNQTTYEIDGLKGNRNYDLQVFAVSSKGASPPARLTISTHIDKHTGDESGESQIFLLMLLIVPFLGTASIALSCRLVREYLHKRKIKAARNHYFKSMDDKDGGEDECSVVPLYEEPLSWLELQGTYAKEAFEIEYKDMVLGDVIGQGAFGVVRRATMSRKQYEELWRKQRNCKKRVIHETGADDKTEETTTVAVKMLKVGNTVAEREELIKEVVTMQNLGCHPQIVSLLGACTRGRALCLVLEYCPGGDLLTFLRQFREKYVPLLNMGCVREGEHSRRSTLEKRGNGSECDRLQSPGDGGGEISYANINKFIEEKSGDSKSTAPVEDTTETDCESDTSLCVSNPMYGSGFLDVNRVDERQVLSYARQIALGMEYLERNHVVHRDLACRNILMTGDHRNVKISDFGLSRDIYTWNVYHQKTDGKLPVKWMAIESIFSHVFTSKSDVWAFGIALWELVTLGGNPYPGIGNNELFHLLKSGYRMERPENCSEELYALMKKCWRSSPADRPKFTELSRHLETLLETGEPNMYLSLQPDIPIGYFSISDLKNDKSETV